MGSHRKWPGGELVGFDLETTGLDRFSDVPVSYALVTVQAGRVTSRMYGLVDPGRDIPAGAVAVHGITTELARRLGMPLHEAVSCLADVLVATAARGVPVVGMKLDYDLSMVDTQCRRLDGHGLEARGWQGPVLDGLVLDRRLDPYRRGRRTLGDLCAHYRVAIAGAHHALVDAEAAIGVVLALSEAFPTLGGQRPAELHRAQMVWHRQWADSYDRWRQCNALLPMDPREHHWPIASVAGS